MRRLIIALALLGTLSTLQAAELLSGRLYTQPQTLYVNQNFEVLLELAVREGCEIGDLRISNFINAPDFISLTQLESLAPLSRTSGGQRLRVYRFMAQARAHRSFAHTFNTAVSCQLIERRAMGFFSRSFTTPAQLSLPPFELSIKELPTAGRPAGFSGAVGQFNMAGRLSDTTLQRGDLLTLELEIQGQGWIAPEFELPVYQADSLLKTYPPKELLREENHLKYTQSLIAQSTNLTVLPELSFVFFDPVAERYTTSRVGPFQLEYSSATSDVREELKIITPELRASTEPVAGTMMVDTLTQAQRHFWPIVIFVGGVFLSLFTFFLIFEQHRLVACVAALLVLGTSLGGAYWTRHKTHALTRTLNRRTAVRFAPASSALALFHLSVGSEVVPLETHAEWLRVDAAGRRGWLPLNACENLE